MTKGSLRWGKTMPGWSCIKQSIGLMAIAPFLITIVFAFGVGYGADLTSRLLVFDEVSQAAGFEGMLNSIGKANRERNSR